MSRVLVLSFLILAGQGELGARLNAGDVATYRSAEDPSLLGTIVSVLASVADLCPDPSNPQLCGWLSMGMTAEAAASRENGLTARLPAEKTALCRSSSPRSSSRSPG